MVLCDRVVPIKHGAHINDELWEVLKKEYGGELLTRPNLWYREPIRNAQWITAAPHYTQEERSYMAYGNEATMRTTYWQLYLRLSVGPAGNRGGLPKDAPFPYDLSNNANK